MKTDTIALRFALLLAGLFFVAGCSASEPPVFRLMVDDVQVDGYRAAYCWRATCVDGAPPQYDAADYRKVPAGEPLRLNLDTPLPETLNLALRDAPFGSEMASVQLQPAAEEVTWNAGVPPGSYVLVASATWSNGDALFFFAVELTGSETE